MLTTYLSDGKKLWFWYANQKNKNQRNENKNKTKKPNKNGPNCIVKFEVLILRYSYSKRNLNITVLTRYFPLLIIIFIWVLQLIQYLYLDYFKYPDHYISYIWKVLGSFRFIVFIVSSEEVSSDVIYFLVCWDPF